MYYFRFLIPTNEDGTRVSYSPNYHGTMPKCPQNVVVDLYNDEEGWGLAHAEDTFKPPEITELLKGQYDKGLKDAEDADKIKDNLKVFYGEKLKHKWDTKVEPHV